MHNTVDTAAKVLARLQRLVFSDGTVPLLKSDSIYSPIYHNVDVTIAGCCHKAILPFSLTLLPLQLAAFCAL